MCFRRPTGAIRRQGRAPCIRSPGLSPHVLVDAASVKLLKQPGDVVVLLRLLVIAVAVGGWARGAFRAGGAGVGGRVAVGVGIAAHRQRIAGLEARIDGREGPGRRVVLASSQQLIAASRIRRLSEEGPIVRSRPCGVCQKSAYPVTCYDGRASGLGGIMIIPCPYACSISSSSESVAGWSCSAGQQHPRTRNCSCCGTRWPCCAEPIPGPGSAGLTGQFSLR